MIKALLKIGVFAAALGLVVPASILAQGGNTPPFSFVTPAFTGTTVPGAQAPMFQNSSVTAHTLSWTVTGTVSSCTVAIQGASTAGGTYSTLGVAQTCTASGTYTIEGSAANWVDINISAFSATGTVTFSYQGYYFVGIPGVGLTDGVWMVPIASGCGTALTTGTYAANPASSGALSAPSMVLAQTSEQLLQVTTTAAASVLKVDCDITPPSRTTSGKGVTITGYTLFYGIQTTALTSITLPTVSTITFPANGGTASGTVAAAGGTLATNPATLQLATTTSGSCYSANVTLGSPVVLNTTNQRLETEWVFNQTGASADVYQICGLEVFYNYSN